MRSEFSPDTKMTKLILFRNIDPHEKTIILGEIEGSKKKKERLNMKWIVFIIEVLYLAIPEQVNSIFWKSLIHRVAVNQK